jgi:hypothetical protein
VKELVKIRVKTRVPSKGGKSDFITTALSVVEQAIGEHMDGSVRMTGASKQAADLNKKIA